MRARSKLFTAVLASALSCAAVANDDLAYENWLIRVGDYKTLAHSWRGEAMSGDAEKQERLADLLLGPHARAAKAQPYEGIQLLFRAAISGRRTAMQRLGAALDKGASGLAKRPDAARCWSRAPTSFEARLACVELTDFDDARARIPCTELAVMEARERPATRDGAAMAQLCLANKTPAILVFGLPPSRQDLKRVSEYTRHGIEWSITGDVYVEAFEMFRERFNRTTVAALEARHGRGYLDRLSKEIEARVARD
ncbi:MULTISPECIES: hypothetical protein [unclassified Massilia]|uniref:hypothetical protein n=1 Tax=unclassified Massilia TaxID=2609279 RepID=UPI001781FD2B|nr:MULTISPECIES: hypothetical protein [unclassified Massilia]MBD8528939.1 hypothetical protein [Massilia sp. CFBP 13647]MBD8673581.1 hypothetical protein [Massilia sp. CFBP 13721]